MQERRLSTPINTDIAAVPICQVNGQDVVRSVELIQDVHGLLRRLFCTPGRLLFFSWDERMNKTRLHIDISSEERVRVELN